MAADPETPPFRVEALLAHREWVERTARALAWGDADAEDLSQQAWVEILARPPAREPGSVRGWLRTVLRFRSVDAARSARTRRIRERSAARPESGGADPSEVVSRAEILDRVVHAVLALEEPTRTTVLLRFFEGLAPAAVAARLGIPVETVRTRIRRALEDLRRRLGGDRGREGMLLALAPLLRPGESSIAATAAGGVAMGVAAKAGLAAGAAVLAVGGAVAWRATTAEAPAPSPVVAVPLAPPSVASVAPPVPPPAPPAAAPSAAPATGPRPAEKEAPDPGPTMEERLAEVVPELEVLDSTVGAVLADMAKRLGLEVEYEEPLVRQWCYARTFGPVRIQSIPLRDILTLAVRSVPCPLPGKVLLWEVRKDRLFIRATDPPPPSPEDEAKAKKRREAVEAMLARVRSTRTTFAFEGESLPEALDYLSARHGMNLIVEERAMPRARELRVRLARTEVPLSDALDEILRSDPDLTWGTDAEVVLVRLR